LTRKVSTARCIEPEMARSKATLNKVAREARYAAINAIYANITDAERRKFAEWQKEHRSGAKKVPAFDWPGLRPYLDALADDLQSKAAD
jgi:hypothetical protein